MLKRVQWPTPASSAKLKADQPRGCPMAGSIAPIASIGVPREIKPDERRVALTPDAVRELVSHGLQVRIEQGAGEGAGISDAAFETAGAAVVD